MNRLTTNGGVLDGRTLAQINQNFSLAGILTQGNVYWVKPRTGNNQANGNSPETAFKTLAAALAACSANQNDVVLLCAEGQAAADTTDYQTTTLDWNKDMVHLIGINDGPQWSQRSRVALISTYDTASNLITVSADNCLISNIQFYAGVAGTLPTGCMLLTGQRNFFLNCHIAGMGNAANDIAAGYSLSITGGAENTFLNCTIGQDTTTLGASVNSVVYLATAATRNYFRDCLFLLMTAHATNTQFVRAAAGGIDRSHYFIDCIFDNAVDSSGTALTQAMTVASGGSPAGGLRLVGRTCVFGATDWNSSDAGNVRGGGYSVTAGTFGLGAAVTR